MQTDDSEVQPENAPSPMTRSPEPESKSTVEREAQFKKHSLQRFSTEEGMQIEERKRHSEKARHSTDLSREPDSNASPERFPSTNCSQIFSTEDGRQTVASRQLRPRGWKERNS
jgi:hypothetical protein